ncbi:tripartite tricarboxylate transporter substrate-binding protein [Rhodoplanes sp. TEM]|uniref:Tripartite tricarboxylate transporter substrate-binding protein n=1 Tax=Rhodoplanes tepidamans TaxID=200616 RepID=A0ABT5JG11_RHOTP|nr:MULTISPECIES: tripartite tricarboxylate transporter substrate-binding protein [Rhodoplanes]MDC7788512.1 tripartite tricarboxylate transporter substrate-binding protein [Rhodoplanes tepidamans]MDC7984166.1 tripartite tricarboxylate transporter substrate-binding protein [Rhodoplanes sp. TEM]MDQ0356854.1 tripartite-type tricarboxylate transporter receptor subunit TctC [Rhodoplanes tepidamans]
MTNELTRTPSRRTLLRGAAGGLVGGLAAPFVVSASAWAQAKYPNRPIKVVVPFGAGGVADITVRIVTERLGDKVGARFVVENAPGAGGSLAATRVASSAPDGYTLALFSNGTAVSVGLFKQLPFDPVNGFVPISTLGLFDFVLATNKQTGYTKLADLIADAKKRPGALNIATVIAGSTQNLSAVLFNGEADIKTEIVVYRTTPDALVSVLRNDAQLVIDSYASLKGSIEDKNLVALATSGARQSPVLPDVPPVAATVPGFDATSWNALFVKSGTPEEVVRILNAGLQEVLVEPEVKRKLLELGIVASASTPGELSDRLTTDIKRWTAVIDKAGIPKQ